MNQGRKPNYNLKLFIKKKKQKPKKTLSLNKLKAIKLLKIYNKNDSKQINKTIKNSDKDLINVENKILEGNLLSKNSSQADFIAKNIENKNNNVL